MQFNLAQLTKNLDVKIKGDENCVITGISSIQESQSGHITFLTNPLYRKYLSTTKASAVILTEKDAALCPINAIITSNPHYTYALIASFFENKPKQSDGVHSTVVIGESCEIHPTAKIAAHTVIGNDVHIGANVVIGPNCVIGDFCQIGEASQLDANVTLYFKTQLGKRNHIASGVVIGSDGFGFAKHSKGWQRVPQIGRVLIGDDVAIGANTAIDRGAVEDTIIEDGVKLDNLIQVGHNVKIGAHTVIAGCVGIAGSVTIGKHCMIGGKASFAGHIQVADHVLITGKTDVTKSILEPGIYSSGVTGVVTNSEFRKNNARFHRLANLIERVKKLESLLKVKRDSTDEV